MRRAPNMEKTKSLIGQIRETELKHGIEKTYDWYRLNFFRKEV